MKNYNSFLLLSLVTFSLFAQDFQGKAYYMSKSKINPEFGKNIPRVRFFLSVLCWAFTNIKIDFLRIVASDGDGLARPINIS